MSCDIHVTSNMAFTESFAANRFNFLYLALATLLLQCVPHCASITQTVGQPWPLPQSYKSGTNVQSLDADAFRFRVVGNDCDLLREAIVRYYKIIFRSAADAAPSHKDEVLRFQPKRDPTVLEWDQENTDESVLGSLDVNVEDKCVDIGYPSLDMDESCMLKYRSINVIFFSFLY